MEGAMMTDMEMEESALDKKWQASVVERPKDEVIAFLRGLQAVRFQVLGGKSDVRNGRGRRIFVQVRFSGVKMRFISCNMHFT